MDRPIAYWKGWEYPTEDNLHMYMSKRHIFVDDSPICGCSIPRLELISRNYGDGACKKCSNWKSKNYEKFDIR